MREVPLTQGKVSLVDDADYKYLNQFKWFAHKIDKTFYAVRDVGKTRLYMHRVLVGIDGLEVDHRDRNGLNNQRYNLRPATRSQNVANQPPHKDNKSGFKGVTQERNRWKARIMVDGCQIHLGCYDTAIEAAKAYNGAALKYFGEFAYRNKV